MDPLFEQKVKSVLSASFRGLHNLPGKLKFEAGRFTLNAFSRSLATCDHDIMTRLVVLSHDQCVRMHLENSGPGHVKLVFSDRKREGDYVERHPTMEEAITKIRDLV